MGVLDWLAKQGEKSKAEQQRKKVLSQAEERGRADAVAYRKKQTAGLTDDEAGRYQRGWDQGIAERQANARQKARDQRAADKALYDD